MRFDLADLGLFLAIADAGSITRGADAAGLSLAAASERLREMEAAGNVRLLDRGRRGVTPTAAGEALLHHARTILQQVALMRGEMGAFARGVRTSIRLFANTAAMSEFLPARLAPWLAAHPQVDVDLRERPSSDIARSVALGFADLGVLSSRVLSGAVLPAGTPFGNAAFGGTPSGDSPSAKTPSGNTPSAGTRSSNTPSAGVTSAGILSGGGLSGGNPPARGASGPHQVSGLTLHPFATDRLVIVAPRDHALAALRRTRLSDLAGEPWLALTEGALQAHLDAEAAKIGLRWQPRIRLRTFDDICRMAAAGVGIGIVPETAARRTRAPVATIRLTDDWATRPLSICLRADTAPAPLTLSLLEHLMRGNGRA